MPPINLTRIIGPYTLADVEAAFTLVHPDPAYTSTAKVACKGEAISIEGLIYCNGAEIGDFSRQLHYAKGSGQAMHWSMEIAPDHKERDIAKHHYTGAIRFYDKTPIRVVRLTASGEGQWIWPQLGFDLASRSRRTACAP